MNNIKKDSALDKAARRYADTFWGCRGSTDSPDRYEECVKAFKEGAAWYKKYKISKPLK